MPVALLVVGIGNIWMQDDGVGVHLLRHLRRGRTPAGVAFLDGGTAGFDLLYRLQGARQVLFLDAVDAGGPAGALYEIDPADLLQEPTPYRASVHEMDLPSLLQAGTLSGTLPPVRILGIQPASVGPGLKLSPAMAAALPAIVRQVRGVLRAHADPARFSQAVRSDRRRGCPGANPRPADSPGR